MYKNDKYGRYAVFSRVCMKTNKYVMMHYILNKNPTTNSKIFSTNTKLHRMQQISENETI